MDLKEVFGVYGKPHRMFVQAMLTRGMVPSNELKKLFDLVMNRCKVQLPEIQQQPKAQQIFYSAINEKLAKKCGMKIVKCLDEETKMKTSFMVLLNKTDRSKDSSKLTIKDQVTFLPHEMEYLKLLVDNIMEDQLHEIRETKALSLHKEVNKSNKKIQSQQDAEIIIHKFKDHKLLTNCKDTEALLLSTKFIFEMEAYLKENYPDLPQCTKCEKEEGRQKIIIRPIECEKDNCPGVYHYYCANKKIVEHRRKYVAKWVPDQCVLCGLELPDRKEVYENIRNNQESSTSAASRKRKRLEESNSESE